MDSFKVQMLFISQNVIIYNSIIHHGPLHSQTSFIKNSLYKAWSMLFHTNNEHLVTRTQTHILEFGNKYIWGNDCQKKFSFYFTTFFSPLSFSLSVFLPSSLTLIHYINSLLFSISLIMPNECTSCCMNETKAALQLSIVGHLSFFHSLLLSL